MALDQSNQNLFAGLSQVAVSIVAPTVVAPPAVKVIPPKTTVTPVPPTVKPTEVPTVVEAPPPATPVPPSAQQASVSSVGNLLNGGIGSWLIVLVVIVAIAYGAYWFIKKRTPKKNK